MATIAGSPGGMKNRFFFSPFLFYAQCIQIYSYILVLFSFFATLLPVHCFFFLIFFFYWKLLQAHIRTLRGRILETILSLRFLIFQYGIVYKLHLAGHNTSLAVIQLTNHHLFSRFLFEVCLNIWNKYRSFIACMFSYFWLQIYGFSWIALIIIVALFKVCYHFIQVPYCSSLSTIPG